MRTRAMINTLAYLTTAVILTTFVATSASAESLPSSKVTVAFGGLTALGVASEPNGSKDTGFVTVLQNYIKMPNQKDLKFDVALQCGIVTDTTVRSKGGNKDEAQAYGKINVRVKLTNIDTGEVRYAEPSEGKLVDGTPMGVTYCSRVQRLEAKFAGLNCTVDLGPESPTYGQVSCADPEELHLVLDTLNANAFNFYSGDITPGVWQIEVQARAETNIELGGSTLGQAHAEAFVGLGSMHVDNSRLIKDAGTGPIVEFP